MHTQCPKCRTIFNVTEQILAVKAGLVRCGDCENVFNATWNLVDEADEIEESPAPPPPSPRQAVTVRPRPGDESAGEEFPLPPPEHYEAEPWPTGAQDVDEDSGQEAHGGQPSAGAAEYRALTRDERPAGESGDAGEDAGDPHERALDQIDDGDTDRVATGGVWDEIDDDAEADISDEEIRRTLRLDRAFDVEDEDENDDGSGNEYWRTDAHDDNERDTSVSGAATTDQPRRGAPAGGRIEPRLDAAPPAGGLSVSAEDGLLPRRPPQKPSSARSPLRRNPAIQLKAPAASTRAAPSPPSPRGGGERLDPNVHWVSIPDGDRRGAQFLWASGVLLAIVLVVLQVRFFLVDELYAIEGTRPYISLFCEFTGCSAPQRTEPGAIDIAQTRVDLHPEVPGAIRINVNLINRAAFAQPYPALELTLSDKDGRIVGRRTYQSADYLRERPETALLDPGILAVATINLAHPNENAVGFETRVVASSGQ